MSKRFSYVKYDEESVALQNQFRELFEAIEALAEAKLTESRAKSLLMTKLEEAYMWVGKAIRDAQTLERIAVEQPERKDD